MLVYQNKVIRESSAWGLQVLARESNQGSKWRLTFQHSINKDLTPFKIAKDLVLLRRVQAQGGTVQSCIQVLLLYKVQRLRIPFDHAPEYVDGSKALGLTLPDLERTSKLFDRLTNHSQRRTPRPLFIRNNSFGRYLKELMNKDEGLDIGKLKQRMDYEFVLLKQRQ